jgi:hypothetical protein
MHDIYVQKTQTHEIISFVQILNELMKLLRLLHKLETWTMETLKFKIWTIWNTNLEHIKTWAPKTWTWSTLETWTP